MTRFFFGSEGGENKRKRDTEGVIRIGRIGRQTAQGLCLKEERRRRGNDSKAFNFEDFSRKASGHFKRKTTNNGQKPESQIIYGMYVETAVPRLNILSLA